MARFDFDLFTIGAGSGGVRCSRLAANHGARVAVAEQQYLGGTCVNVGCVPKKLLVYASHFAEDFEDAGGYGWSEVGGGFDWAELIENKDREIARLNGVYRKLLTASGVEIIEGRATLVDPHTIEIGERRVTAERILVATGGHPFLPDAPGSEHAITSDDVFHLDELPARAVVVGGGYIGVEFAGIFNGLGVETTLLYRGPLFMRGFDDDVRNTLAAEMRRKGVTLRFETLADHIDKQAEALVLTLQDGSKLETDLVLCALGRVPNTAGIGLERQGVRLDGRGAIEVDEQFRSSVPHIYAIGDVIGRMQLTPVAIAEATVLADNLFGGKQRVMDYDNIPSAVFSQPSVGTVGLTEAEARRRFGAIDVYRSSFRPMKHTLTGSEERTMMKLVVDRASDRVLGLHMVGPDAGEITQGFAVALKCGATKAQFDATVGIHPTAAEELVTLRTPVGD